VWGRGIYLYKLYVKCSVGLTVRAQQVYFMKYRKNLRDYLPCDRACVCVKAVELSKGKARTQLYAF
jgi:hypothetical protein